MNSPQLAPTASASTSESPCNPIPSPTCHFSLSATIRERNSRGADGPSKPASIKGASRKHHRVLANCDGPPMIRSSMCDGVDSAKVNYPRGWSKKRLSGESSATTAYVIAYLAARMFATDARASARCIRIVFPSLHSFDLRWRGSAYYQSSRIPRPHDPAEVSTLSASYLRVKCAEGPIFPFHQDGRSLQIPESRSGSSLVGGTCMAEVA